MKVKFTRILATALSVCMVLGMIPAIPSFAARAKFEKSKLEVVTCKESTLANGVELDSYTVYDKKGDQVKLWVTTADMSVDTVKIFASYQNMDPTKYGMSKLTQQVSAFNEKAEAGDEYYQGTVVAGINSSYYNMTTGKPTGAFVMNGIDVTNETEGNQNGYFAVMKDGSVKIGSYKDYSADKGNIQEAIGIYHMLVENGEIVKYQRDGKTPLDDVTKYPRQTIGITADNKVIIMTADGNQAPKSIGLTLVEQAQVMLDLGCVWAGHLDGGGSCTYGNKAEGADNFALVNNPSDGSERDISNGLIIVSQEEQSNAFNKVAYTITDENVSPGTSTKIDVKGVSTSGNSADIPAEVTYMTSNGTYENGVFTAGNELGVATITAMYNGKDVGTTTINVVLPDKIEFSTPLFTVPYGKSVELEIKATLGAKIVKVKAEDFEFTFSNDSIGVLNGFTFTAVNDAPIDPKSGVVATLKGNTELSTSTEINLGKGSEVIYDFENGTEQGLVFDEPSNSTYNYTFPITDQNVITSTNGKVHSGNYALSMHADYSNSLESGYMRTSLYSTEEKVFENATGIGAWIYIPDEFESLWVRWTIKEATLDSNGKATFSTAINSDVMDITKGGTGVVYTFDEPGWHYLYADTSAYKAVGWPKGSVIMQFYLSDRDGSAYNYVAKNSSNIPSKYQFYLDDVTVDYSSAVEDREAPVISNMTYATVGMPDAVKLNNQTINTNTVSIGAKVEEYTVKTNYTGVDASTVKVYVDGVEVASKYANNMVTCELDGLTNGKHTIKVAAADKMGNYACEYEYITVNVKDNASTIKLVATDPTLDRILLGSIYNMDLVATAIEEVQEVEVVVDLDNNSTWQLDHMTVAKGFTATYSVEATDNIATIKIKRTGTNSETGEITLVTLPVRVWELETGYKYPNGNKKGQEALTYAQWKTNKEFWKMSVIAEVDKGVLTRVDDSVSTFTGERVFCDTEMYMTCKFMIATDEGNAYYNSWNGGHIHKAEVCADVAATCTENGYTGRTFCKECNSVVDWGTTEKAIGHNYEVVDEVYKCTCGVFLEGTHTDGKFYVAGVAAEGWLNDRYYVEGVSLIGIKEVDGFYYDFGEDGTCNGQAKFTGMFYDETAEGYRYSKLGKLASGWFQVEEEWYYFVPNTMVAAEDSVTTEDGITYDFEEGRVLDGKWVTYNGRLRYWYGPAYYKNTAKNVEYIEAMIDGYKYLFNSAGYMQTGIVLTHLSNDFTSICYDCGTDGKAVGYNGVYGSIFYKDGIQQKAYQLVEYNGEFFFISDGNQIAKNTTMYLSGSVAGHTYADGTPLQPGYYEFGADGKMIIKNGVEGDYLYINNVRQEAYKLVQYDGNFYFISDGHKIARNATMYLSGSVAGYTYADGTPLQPGYFDFDAEGKMVVRNGVIGDYLYIQNVKQEAYKLVEYNGDFYFINDGHKIAKNTTMYLSGSVAGYTYADGTPLQAGYFDFGADGKMIIRNGIVGDYLYINNVRQTAYKLVQYEGDFYFISDAHKIAKNTTMYLSGSVAGYTYADGTPLEPGYFDFDADGKMVVRNGVIGDYLYINNVRQTAYKLVQYEGDFYFISDAHKIAKNTTMYLSGSVAGYTYADGTPLQAGYFDFDADGKMVIKNGVIGDYLYIQNVRQTAYKLVQYDGDFYFISDGHKVAKNTKMYLSGSLAGYTDAAGVPLKAGYYEFGTDGKMIIN